MENSCCAKNHWYRMNRKGIDLLLEPSFSLSPLPFMKKVETEIVVVVVVVVV